MNPVAILFGAFVLVVTVELLRRRSLREKYAAVWLLVSLAVIVFAVAPVALVTAARLLGFTLPVNLLFLLGGLVLTAISMQLSLEVGRLEDQSQRLAEEVALLRVEVTRLSENAPDPSADTGMDAQDRPVAPSAASPGERTAEKVVPQLAKDDLARVEV